MSEIYLEVLEPGSNWSRVGGQGFANEEDAIVFAKALNREMAVFDFEYRAVKIEKVVLSNR